MDNNKDEFISYVCEAIIAAYQKQVVPGIKIDKFSKVVMPANFSEFVRIAIQSAKELAMDRNNRDLILKRFHVLKGTCTTGLIERIEPLNNGRNNIIVYLGQVEGCLPPEEQLLNEAYTVGNRLRIFIMKLQDEQAEAKIIISRIHPELERELSKFLSDFQADS